MAKQATAAAQAKVQHTDILIVGAGMVGAAAALGFAQQGYQVTVVEPYPQYDIDTSGEYDLRISAVTTDNIQLLDKLGAWAHIAALRIQPFTQLAVRHHAGDWLTLGAEKAGDSTSNLGYMIENRVIQHGLLKAMQADDAITLIEGELDTLDSQQGEAVVSTGQRISFATVLGCDGANSKVRQASGIGVAGKAYGQSCLLSVVQCSNELPARTWESFASGGEIHALLPLANRQACLIMYGTRAQVAQWQASKAHLQQVLQSRFEDETGAFELMSYGSFPLTRQSALRYVQERTILLGDAAHTIHPMAGQGVNLGFRDVKKLLDVTQGLRLTGAQQSLQVRFALRQFELVRRADNELMAQAMDSIGWAFKQDRGAVAGLRNALLASMHRISPMQKLLTAYASGVWKV